MHLDGNVREQCNTALNTLQHARMNLGGRRFGRNFAQVFLRGRKRVSCGDNTEDQRKHSHSNSWTHTFYCLSQAGQGFIPSTNEERDLLMEAGLGEKKITIPDLDVSGDNFRTILYDAYPKLKHAGGYTFAKCKANSKYIEPLSGYCLTSPRILRDRVGNTRTYIIPMQKDLDLSSVVDLGHSDVSCQCQ